MKFVLRLTLDKTTLFELLPAKIGRPVPGGAVILTVAIPTTTILTPVNSAVRFRRRYFRMETATNHAGIIRRW